MWLPQYGQMENKERVSVHSWPNQKRRVSRSICCAVCVCPLTSTAFLTVASKCHFWGSRAGRGRGELNVPREAVGTQPICESETLCNSLPLSRLRMYLSNHLNYYNHCRNGNARISSLTLQNFWGAESTPRWVLVSLHNTIMLCEMSLPQKWGRQKTSWSQMKTRAVTKIRL